MDIKNLKELTNEMEVEGKSNWKFTQVSMPYLFHYTGINALKSILEIKELWASKSDFLNDYSETNYIAEVFGKVNKFVQENYNAEITTFFNLINDDLVNYFERKINGEEQSSIFIISLSENSDYLVFWSNYSSTDGYNLCLSVECLFEILISQRDKGCFDTVFLAKIIYDESEQIKILFDEIMKIYKLYKEHAYTNIEHAIVLCQIAVETYSMFFKKDVFKQEDECRIAVIIHDKEKLKNIKYRIGNGSLIPYLPIPFIEPDSPLYGVTIGPKNNSDTSIIGLRHFLKHSDYSNISNNIYKSKIPLRF